MITMIIDDDPHVLRLRELEREVVETAVKYRIADVHHMETNDAKEEDAACISVAALQCDFEDATDALIAARRESPTG